jgi:hypothetical protein
MSRRSVAPRSKRRVRRRVIFRESPPIASSRGADRAAAATKPAVVARATAISPRGSARYFSPGMSKLIATPVVTVSLERDPGPATSVPTAPCQLTTLVSE